MNSEEKSQERYVFQVRTDEGLMKRFQTALEEANKGEKYITLRRSDFTRILLDEALTARGFQ